MPRFNELEKVNIRKNLIQKGTELFILYGLKKTTIDNIATACGISKGSFYAFYETKEDLYLEIWLKEEAKFNEFLTEIMQSYDDAKEMLIEVCRGTFRYFEMNPFHRNMYEKKEMEQLVRKLAPEKLSMLINQDNSTFVPLIKKLQEEKKIIPIDPETVMGIHRCLSMLPLIRQEVGAAVFPAAIEHMIQFIAEGLTKSENGRT
ncbi:TetR/AcrR family transcriptional regulator [Ammoniphilus sp. CFH 90114]|uniref:TetR/AcrR family transcriptional regulator n=1 Tax=Ammoniphilus sp. CFH 90114 TaxID=2493665 RepID=UPI0013E98E0E|nr:TetR/AcrR family transcriptional regulator [Ammoniphilus sp. CFH 90114]